MRGEAGHMKTGNSIIAAPSVSVHSGLLPRNIAENDVRLVVSPYKHIPVLMDTGYIATGEAQNRCNCLYISSRQAESPPFSSLSLHYRFPKIVDLISGGRYMGTTRPPTSRTQYALTVFLWPLTNLHIAKSIPHVQPFVRSARTWSEIKVCLQPRARIAQAI